MIKRMFLFLTFTAALALGQAFNADSAFSFLERQVSFGPRNPGSEGHKRCLTYIEKQLRQYADEVVVQNFAVAGYGEQLDLYNVIGRFNPDTKDRLLLCAHWDTRPRADMDTQDKNKPILGANDGASGVAVLLEIARILKDNPPVTGVDIVFFDGEDYGYQGDLDLYFLGSRNFVEVNDISVYGEGILLDMVGDKNLSVYKEYYSEKYHPGLVREIWEIAGEYGFTGFIDRVEYGIDDDHLILNKAGIPSIDIIDFKYPDETNRFWHTHNDIPANCSAESLGQVGTVVLEYVYRR